LPVIDAKQNAILRNAAQDRFLKEKEPPRIV